MKIIYNVTIIIDHSCHDEWLEWMKEIHIPEVLSTGKFMDNKILKIMEDHNPDGITYGIQYTCKNLETFQDYEQNHAPALRKKTEEKFGGKYGAFRTLLEVIE